MKNDKKNNAAILWGVAFVWFTTHFGGGFASGAQIYSYFVRFGILCLITPVLAMLYNAVFFAYSMHFAKKHEVYDYRSYNNAFYGRFAPVFSNLFEVLYLCVMCVAPAVAFATGGATLNSLTGLPYLLCTLIIGALLRKIRSFTVFPRIPKPPSRIFPDQLCHLQLQSHPPAEDLPVLFRRQTQKHLPVPLWH